jgi:hypothetical protein
MTPQTFIAKWKQVELSERSACQLHFLDLCDLLGQPKPAEVDPKGEWYTFERGVDKTIGGKGFADVWMQGKFGWDYKGKHKNLAAAYQQLLQYREALEFPGSVNGPLHRYVHDANDRGIGTVRYPRTVPKDAASAAKLKARTLTNLYNEMPTWLKNAHRKLDEAVFAAYGWPADFSDEEILRRLLELNLERAGSE